MCLLDLSHQPGCQSLSQGEASRRRNEAREATEAAEKNILEHSKSDLLLGCDHGVFHLCHPVGAAAASRRLATSESVQSLRNNLHVHLRNCTYKA